MQSIIIISIRRHYLDVHYIHYCTLRSSILRGNSVDMCSPKVPYFAIKGYLEATQSHNIKRTDELTLDSAKRYRMTTHGLRRF